MKINRTIYSLTGIFFFFLVGCAGSGDTRNAEKTDGEETDAPVLGIDISEWQTSLLENPNAFDSLTFVICRATYGTEQDTAFTSNWNLIKKNKVVGGMYHYYYGNIDIQLQADAFIAALKNMESGDLPPIIDIEDVTYCNECNDSLVQDNLENFIKRIEDASGRTPVLYVNLSCGNACLNNDFYSQYPLYVAYYDSTAKDPVVPNGWQKNGWVFWQKNPKHKTVGVDTDFDVFNGTQEDFLEFIKTSHK